MKILVRFCGSPEHRFLVEVVDRKRIKEINTLVSKHKHSKAIVTALVEGKLLKEVPEEELPRIKADLILTESHAYRDLT